MPKLHQIIDVCCLWSWLTAPLTALCMLCISGFVDDDMFTDNRPYGGVALSSMRCTIAFLYMTSDFNIVKRSI